MGEGDGYDAVVLARGRSIGVMNVWVVVVVVGIGML